MKSILITGANSYIGMTFEDYIKQSNGYTIDTIDMKDESWKNQDFSKYDVIFHVAGIAHADVGHVSEETKALYYQVNTELAYKTAKKAKAEGVKQFIFMSSLIVYGESAPMGKTKVIHKNTKPTPANFYGDSKLQAEIKLDTLQDEHFKVCILRPPMIYGPNSKGNYQLLSKIAHKAPLFPNVNNSRSTLFVGNLCAFIKKCIDENLEGIYHPQNKEVTSTADIVRGIAKVEGKKIWVTKLLNPFVWLASKIPGKIGGMANKAFGSITYSTDLEPFDFDYIQYTFEDSIRLTEGNK